MPTTKTKNILYRFLLPLFAPQCDSRPISGIAGGPLVHESEFIRLLHRHHILGSSTLLASGQRIMQIYTDSSSPSHHASPDTFFRVASITKSATAILAMKLAENGILTLDSPVSTYFSSQDAAAVLQGITLRHLLSHTSGLVDPPGLESVLENHTPFTEILPAARISSPGQSFHYSNLGFGLIGCVMESVLNQPVSQIFRDYLFIPLGMSATLEGCDLPAGQIMPVTRVFPYRKARDLVITRLGSTPLLSPEPLFHYGHTAGSMYTNAVSLHRLLDVLINHDNQFLSEMSVNEMKKEHASYGSLSPTLTYGLGLLRIRDSSIADGIVYGHQGFAYGCADGAFWDELTGNLMIMLNGGCSEARKGRLGLANRDLLYWAFRKEIPSW